MTRFVCSLLLFLATTALAQTPDPLLGVWSGPMRYGAESMMIFVRFDVGKSGKTVMRFDIPAMKLHEVGPFPVEQREGEYKSYIWRFRLAAVKGLAGTWSFDGHDLTMELARAAASPPAPAPPPETSARV